MIPRGAGRRPVDVVEIAVRVHFAEEATAGVDRAEVRLGLGLLRLRLELEEFGMAMAARMPMIATTIINSISVNPFLLLSMLNIFSPSS